MHLVLVCSLIGVLVSAEVGVLDPALYLLPSPPLAASLDNISPGERWKISEATRVTREADAPDSSLVDKPTTTEKSETMEGADTFWPALRAPYSIRGIQIPLTFSITGSYGNSGSYGTGVIGSSYASISSDGGFGNYGKSALAGSSYGTYPGVRVYGGSGKVGWSGWGNGKWGHYGKG